MFAVETYAAVRQFVFIEGNSRREAARVFGLSRDTIAKMCRYAAPPGYVRTKPVERPKLGPLIPVIDAILDADKTAPTKQRHTAKRIFERLRDEHGFAGGYTVVKDYVRLARARSREVFIPLAHPPGHAQVDFGECVGVIGGVRMKLHVFCFDLPEHFGQPRHRNGAGVDDVGEHLTGPDRGKLVDVADEQQERSHWREASSEEFRQAWEAEVASLLELTESTFHIVTGLLLPVWNRLPDEAARVYRLQTIEGERVIGRLVSPASAAILVEARGAGAPALAPTAAIAAVMQEGAGLVLAEGLVLKRSLIMNRQRLELVGFGDTLVDRLKAQGLTSDPT